MPKPSLGTSELSQLGKTLWAIADQLRGAMNADDFRDYMLARAGGSVSSMGGLA